MLQHAYTEVTGNQLKDIDDKGTLYRAMLDNFKNQEEFPNMKES